MSGDADANALRDALVRAAAYGVQGKRERRLGKAADGLSFVYDQIAGSILERRLIFLFDDVPRLECDVKGGRLLRFTSLEITGETALDCILDVALGTESTDENLQAFARTALALCGGAGKIALRLLPLNDVLAAGHAGASPASIAKSFGLAIVPGAPIEIFQRFVQSASERVTAAAYLQEDMLHPLAGDEAGLDLLVTLIEEGLSDNAESSQGLGNVLSEDGMICWTNDGGEEPGVLVAALGNQMFFAATRPTSHAALANLWYRAQSSS